LSGTVWIQLPAPDECREFNVNRRSIDEVTSSSRCQVRSRGMAAAIKELAVQ
jgi:hypothetical protein